MERTEKGKGVNLECFSSYLIGSWESVRKSIVEGARAVVRDYGVRRVYVYGVGSNGRVEEVVGLLRGEEELRERGVEVFVEKPEKLVFGRDYEINVDGTMNGHAE